MNHVFLLKYFLCTGFLLGATSLLVVPPIDPSVTPKTVAANLRMIIRQHGNSVPPLSTPVPTKAKLTPNIFSDSLPCQQSSSSPKTHFLVFAGGGSPDSNEIALEKNVLYFQRTLRTKGFQPSSAQLYFANGTNGQSSIRYLNPDTKVQQFKVPEIPYLLGSSSTDNLRAAIQQLAQKKVPALFFYFTGHGAKNPGNFDNNSMILWNNQLVSVKQLSRWLVQFPEQTSVVSMMAQCYAGSFANFIYENGDPRQPVAPHNRCGFFATVKERPSVGCTPEVNEADYRDYSSSFFAGLSGRSRIGEVVLSADFNRDGRVTYHEAHGYAKVDDHSIDLPISTSEAWLQDLSTADDQRVILEQPIIQWLKGARPEQRFVINSLVQRFQLEPKNSFMDNIKSLSPDTQSSDINEAYLIRLGMELYNVGMEQKIRKRSNRQQITILERILNCEAGSWR